VRLLAVEDPLEALGKLARAWVDGLWSAGCKVIGITGSTGKTSTKDILGALLGPPLDGAVHTSPANYNTEVGLPLAVLGAPRGTRALVLEMAMRGPGQIRELTEIAPPQIGVITNVGPVHLELLGTVEAVAAAKAELITALPPEGTCVVPAAAEALRPHLRRSVRTLTFATWPPPAGDAVAEVERVADAAANVRVLAAEPARVGETDGLRIEVVAGADQATLEVNFRQAHNVVNLLAAIGAAHALDLPLEALAEGGRDVPFSALRGDRHELPDDVLVIDDSYNANPISMRAALDYLAELASEREGARAVAILGEMSELGPDAGHYHREVGAHAAARGVELLLAVGPLGDQYVDGYDRAGQVERSAGAQEAALAAAELIKPGDVVLVKASRSVGLEIVAERLAAGAAR